MTTRLETALSSVAIIAAPNADNIALATIGIGSLTALRRGDDLLVINQDVLPGERFALRDIPAGEFVLQYGYPFARSKGITRGDKINYDNTVNEIPEIADDENEEIVPPREAPGSVDSGRTFLGYPRPDGRCGTRNFVVIVPTSMCASAVAQQIAERFSGNYPGVDGVMALPSTEGCGCAGGLQIERFATILQNSILHENVAAALIIDLGCEQTNYEMLSRFIGTEKLARGGKPVDWITIQKAGGAAATVALGSRTVEGYLGLLAGGRREPCPISALTVAGECGASDAFSGLTANRVIGAAIDRVIAAGGSAIFSEFPEMVGAEQLLFPRMRNREIREKFKRQMRWYQEMAVRMGTTMDHNLVPENRAGGLLNPYVKSLGAVMKGGTAPIEDVIDYGERISARGLHIMQGPGNDLESVTGLAASGATMICFSTGRGTVTGCALAPVLKISSTTDLFRRLPDDIDFDAGSVLEGGSEAGTRVRQLGDELFEMILAAASGSYTKPELNHQRQFQIWTAGKLSL